MCATPHSAPPLPLLDIDHTDPHAHLSVKTVPITCVVGWVRGLGHEEGRKSEECSGKVLSQRVLGGSGLELRCLDSQPGVWASGGSSWLLGEKEGVICELRDGDMCSVAGGLGRAAEVRGPHLVCVIHKLL